MHKKIAATLTVREFCKEVGGALHHMYPTRPVLVDFGRIRLQDEAGRYWTLDVAAPVDGDPPSAEDTLAAIVRERVYGDATPDSEQRIIDLCREAAERFGIERLPS